MPRLLDVQIGADVVPQKEVHDALGGRQKRVDLGIGDPLKAARHAHRGPSLPRARGPGFVLCRIDALSYRGSVVRGRRGGGFECVLQHVTGGPAGG